MNPARAKRPIQTETDVLGELLSFRFGKPELEAESRKNPEGLAVNGLEALLDDYVRQTRETRRSSDIASPAVAAARPAAAPAARPTPRCREAMRRSTVYLTDEQHRLLSSAAKALGRMGGREVSRSQVVRSALDTLLGDPRGQDRRSGLAEAFLFLGEEPPRGE